MSDQANETAVEEAAPAVSAQTTFTITREQLPLHCPTPEMSLWNSHPRVYLPIEDSGKETCPYCGAVYVLAEQGSS